ncbi:hypothetical protein [Paraburkholderia sp. WP4_3_2]|uniref:hypothetical protein n=1 Tax=Paraburkholderia sp. WP4_3_2 TaxID=2587162 RepID=UPI001611A5E1|nr:hypothetical protein [Paraburkholderia sp. WP4_3_2]MBB3256895.1 hypothetical protein [Paraburkholderia sp. WP4_3_2]
MTDEEALAKSTQAFNDARSRGRKHATHKEILMEVRRRRKRDPALAEALKQTGLMMLRAEQGH